MPQKLGQHFLKDARALSRIISALEISKGDTIVEIGPGHGELTRRILKENPKSLIVIEKDKTLIKKFLNPLQDTNKNLEIISGDALGLISKTTGNLKNYKVVGNIPYYITGYLLRELSKLGNKPRRIVLTTQKEVALRLTALPPKMNLLAASIQFWGIPEIVRFISKKSFKPPPKVDSAIIKIVPHKIQPTSAESEKYYRLLKILFSHPRKTALNNLSDELKIDKEEVEKVLKNQGIEPKSRPQNLNTESIKKLASIFIHTE